MLDWVKGKGKVMEQREFLKIIQAYRRRLNMAGFLKILLFALCVGAGAGILLQAAAFIIPIYYVNLYTVAAFLLAAFAAIIGAFVKRADMKQTALAMDRFGFAERIVTAYENLTREGDLIALQREDAMRELHTHQDRIRIPLLPPAKKMLLFLAMLALVTGLAFVPSVTKEHASELHSVKEEAKEKTKELEALVETLEEIAQEELTPEQQAQIQEMIESLESSLSEYQQAVSSQMLASASQKLDYKYQNMAEQMSSLAQSLQNGASVSVASLEAMQEMAQQLQNMSGQQLAQGQNSQNGNGQNGQNGNGQNGQNGNGQNGQNGNGQNGHNGNGQNGQSGQSGNGDGQGNQNGGDGDGTGGKARGEGSSDNAHDYVSVPNAIVDSENLMGNAGNHENSDFFRAQNGLSWEGEHISHEAVIGSYEQNAYEGISAGKYPSGMEEIIKEYFASFNSR